MCSVRLWPLACGPWVQIQTAILNAYHRGKLLHLPLDALTWKAAWEVKHATPHWAAAQAKPIGYVWRSVAVQEEDAVCLPSFLGVTMAKQTPRGEAASGGLHVTHQLQAAPYLQA